MSNRTTNDKKGEGNTTRRERVKKHFRDNRRTYIASSISTVVTSAATVLFMRNRAAITATIATIIKDSKDVTVTTYQQTISVYGNKLGRPGIPVIDITTGKRYESESLAAKALGVSVSNLSNHLRGRMSNLNGHVFERLFD